MTSRQEKELDRLLGLGEGAAVLNVFGVYKVAILTLSDLNKRHKRLMLMVHPDKTPKERRADGTRCAQIVSTAIASAKEFVEKKLACMSAADEKLVPIPPSLCFFFDARKQRRHIRRMLKHGVGMEHFKLIDEEKDELSNDRGTNSGFNSGGRTGGTSKPTASTEEKDVDAFSAGEENIFRTSRDAGSHPLEAFFEEMFADVDDETTERNEQGTDGDDEERNEPEAAHAQHENGTAPVEEEISKQGPGSTQNEEEVDNGEKSGEREEEVNVPNKNSKRDYRNRVRYQGREALAMETELAQKWVPRRAVQIKLDEDIEFPMRWECDRFCCEHAAWHGIPGGINVHQTTTYVMMRCRRKICAAAINFHRNPGTGLWRLTKGIEHTDECIGELNGPMEKITHFSAAYTSKQIVRAIIPHVGEKDIFSAADIRDIIVARGIYTRVPSMRQFRAVKSELMTQMSASRRLKMASMPGYIQLLQEKGHRARHFTVDGIEMKKIRMKAAKFIFDQSKKSGHSGSD